MYDRNKIKININRNKTWKKQVYINIAEILIDFV